MSKFQEVAFAHTQPNIQPGEGTKATLEPRHRTWLGNARISNIQQELAYYQSTLRRSACRPFGLCRPLTYRPESRTTRTEPVSGCLSGRGHPGGDEARPPRPHPRRNAERQGQEQAARQAAEFSLRLGKTPPSPTDHRSNPLKRIISPSSREYYRYGTATRLL